MKITKNIIWTILLPLFCMVTTVTIATPITFNGFTGTFPYTENGFTVIPTQTPAGSSWDAGSSSIGTSTTATPPGPNQTSMPGQIEINFNNGGLFYFNSVDLTGSVFEYGQIGYSITGLFNGATIFRISDSLYTSYGGELTHVTNPIPSSAIDSLFITFGSNPSLNLYYSAVNIDVSSPVPESSKTLTLFGMSMAFLILLRNTQQKIKTQ